MAQEARRFCGYRKVHALYLVAEGIWIGCDRIPFQVGSCPICGEGIHFPRSLHKINPVKMFGQHGRCKDRPECPVCHPVDEIAFILGVGEKFYRPEEFLFEAVTMGVSKRIPAIPKELVLGKTRVYLIHRKGTLTGFDAEDKATYDMAVFAAFVPTRIEMPIWKSEDSTEKREELEKRGITPVVFEDGDPDHE